VGRRAEGRSLLVDEARQALPEGLHPFSRPAAGDVNYGPTGEVALLRAETEDLEGGRKGRKEGGRKGGRGRGGALKQMPQREVKEKKEEERRQRGGMKGRFLPARASLPSRSRV